jgi:hypothetical protein
MPELLGAMHNHSTYSADGETDLTALAAMFRARGYRFAAITEHAEDLAPEAMSAYVDRCRSLSDDDFCLIPGLEVRSSEGLHVVGVRVTDHIGGGSASSIIRAIQRQGGLAILAHAKPGQDAQLAARDGVPDGLELWNTKYDSRYAPRLHRFAMFRRLRALNPELRGYCAVDYHWPTQYLGARLAVQAERADEETLVEALRAGRFTPRVGDTVIDPAGQLTAEQLARFTLWACYTRPLLSSIRGMKRTARALRLPLPKRRLRRILLKVT